MVCVVRLPIAGLPWNTSKAIPFGIRRCRLLPLVDAAPYTTEQFDESNHFGGEVEVTLVSGEILRSKVLQAVGRTSDDPLPRPLLKEKFVDCCARTLTARAIEDLYARVDECERVTDVRVITTLATDIL